jgi:hypothetical protein
VAKAKPAKTKVVVTSPQATPSSAAENRPAKAVTKTQAVKQYLAKHPDAKPLEVARVMKTRGIEITPKHISVIKTSLKAKARSAKPAAPAPTKPIAPAPAKVAVAGAAMSQPPATEKTAEKETVPVADLRAAKQFVQQLGGLEQVQRVIALLAELTR